jgi:hypothetical protein
MDKRGLRKRFYPVNPAYQASKPTFNSLCVPRALVVKNPWR